MLPEAVHRLVPVRGPHLALSVAAAALLTGGLAAPALAASTAPVAPTASASPSSVGTLYVTPTTGDIDTPITLETSAACPSGSSNVIVMIFGKGFPAAGYNVVGNVQIKALTAGPDNAYEVPLTNTLDFYASQQPGKPTLSGTYTFLMTCQLPFGHVFGTMSGSIVFGAGEKYTTVAADVLPSGVPTPGSSLDPGVPVTPPAPLPTPTGTARIPGAAVGAPTSSPSAKAGAAGGASAASGGSGAGSAGSGRLAASTSHEPGVPVVAYIAGGVTLVLVAGGVLFGLGARDRRRSAGAS